MKGNTFRCRTGVVKPGAFAIVSFFLLWPFARLDFDRHHDGYMLAQAIAVHQGERVHADVFAQYGPVTPWLQSLALFLPMGPGLALRTLNVAFIALTVFFLADMGRRGPRNWPVSRAAGWWAAVSWIVLADVWLGIPMLPWSSTLGAMLSVMTLYFFTRSMRSAEDGYNGRASATILLAGISLGLMPFTRINVGLSALAVCSVAAALMAILGRGAKRVLAGLFVGGATLSLLTVVLILFDTNSLADFYAQSVKGPLTWGRTIAGTWRPWENLARILLYQLPPALLVCSVLFLKLRKSTRTDGSVTKSSRDPYILLVGVLVAIWECLTLSNLFLYFFMVLSIVASIMTCIVLVLVLVVGGRGRDRLIPWLLLGGLTISGYTQILPIWDARHVWWGAPIGLLLLFSIIGARSNLNTTMGNPLIPVLILAAIMASISGYDYWSSQRVEGSPGTVIAGMLVEKPKMREIDQDTEFLEKRLRSADSIVYLVADGDLSVLDGRYRSADPYFVDWGGPPSLKTRIRGGNPIVVQAGHLSADRVKELFRSTKYRVIARSERLVVLMPVDAQSD